MIRFGMVRLGPAWQGKDSLSWWRLPQIVKARRGQVRRGTAWRGPVGQGEDSFELVAVTRMSRHGTAWRGEAGQGGVRHGSARQGLF
jgi:hypothetical protein